LAAAITMCLVIVWSLKFRGVVTKFILVTPVFLVLFYATWSYADSSSDLSVESTADHNRHLTKASSAFAGAEELQGADSIVDVALFNLPRVLFGPFPNELNLSPVMLLAASSNIFWI